MAHIASLLSFAIAVGVNEGAPNPECPYVPSGGVLDDSASKCFCSLAGNCAGCACKQGCGAVRLAGAVSDHTNTVSFASADDQVKDCTSSIDLLTIPKSYYADLKDLSEKCPLGMSWILEDMLTDGYHAYIAAGGSTEVWQCIRHADTVKIHWLHLHTFCSTGHTHDFPSVAGYCAKMSSANDAKEVASKIYKWVADVSPGLPKPVNKSAVKDPAFMRPSDERPVPWIHSLTKRSQCAFHGLAAVDEALDAGVYVWAAVERCGHSGDSVQCEVDVASATESILGMGNLIGRTVNKCGTLKTHHPKCAAAVGEFLQSTAGLAAHSGGIVEHCPNKLHGDPHYPAYRHWKYGRLAHCFVDAKDSMKALLRAIKRLMIIKRNCVDDPHEKSCAINLMGVVGALAAIGEFIAGAVGHCGHGEHQGLLCTSEIMGTLRHLTNIGKAGAKLSERCHPGEEQLYLENFDDDIKEPSRESSSLLTNVALAMLLPITAVMSFKVGSRCARLSPEQRARGDFETMVME